MEFRFIDPAIDFSNGLEVIRAYHRNLLAKGQELVSLVEDLSMREMSKELAEHCIAIHCHYARTTILHHQDEEQGLFPMITQKSPLIDGMIERLAIDHGEIEEAWDEVSEILGKPEQLTDAETLKQRVRTFEKLLREHLIREDEDFLPKVELLLDSEQLRQMGDDMAKLRNLPF